MPSSYESAAREGDGESLYPHQGGRPPRVEATSLPMWKKVQLLYEAKDAALTAYFDKRPWATRSLFVFVVVLSLACASLMFVVITSDYGGGRSKGGSTIVNTTTPGPAQQ